MGADYATKFTIINDRIARFPRFCPPRRNDCECMYIDKPLSEDIGCENQTGDRCITTEECEKNTNEPKIYSYTKKIRKCNDCFSKFAGQPLKLREMGEMEQNHILNTFGFFMISDNKQ